MSRGRGLCTLCRRVMFCHDCSRNRICERQGSYCICCTWCGMVLADAPHEVCTVITAVKETTERVDGVVTEQVEDRGSSQAS